MIRIWFSGPRASNVHVEIDGTDISSLVRRISLEANVANKNPALTIELIARDLKIDFPDDVPVDFQAAVRIPTGHPEDVVPEGYLRPGDYFEIPKGLREFLSGPHASIPDHTVAKVVQYGPKPGMALIEIPNKTSGYTENAWVPTRFVSLNAGPWWQPKDAPDPQPKPGYLRSGAEFKMSAKIRGAVLGEKNIPADAIGTVVRYGLEPDLALIEINEKSSGYRRLAFLPIEHLAITSINDHKLPKSEEPPRPDTTPAGDLGPAKAGELIRVTEALVLNIHPLQKGRLPIPGQIARIDTVLLEEKSIALGKDIAWLSWFDIDNGEPLSGSANLDIVSTAPRQKPLPIGAMVEVVTARHMEDRPGEWVPQQQQQVYVMGYSEERPELVMIAWRPPDGEFMAWRWIDQKMLRLPQKPGAK